MGLAANSLADELEIGGVGEDAAPGRLFNKLRGSLALRLSSLSK